MASTWSVRHGATVVTSDDRPVYDSKDEQRVREGDLVFNYYDQEWGRIGPRNGWDGWFEFTSDQGRHCLLNGERIVLNPRGYLLMRR